jgi:glutamate racemase
MKNKPIGIFDSGVGGLTVLKEIEKILPYEDIVYFGDTARVPYGNKSKSTIIKFSIENILFLLRKKVKIVVVACNTSSSLALDYLKKTFNIPILGVIEAGIRKAIEVSKNKRIGIIGTQATIESKSYQKQILKKDKTIKVYAHSCPLFVPLVEEGIVHGKIVREIIRIYLKPLKEKGVDTLILGCTHYPLLKKEIGLYLKRVNIINSAEQVALYVKDILKKKNILNDKRRSRKIDFYLTDEVKNFLKLARLFLKREIPKPKIINNV